MTARDEGRRLGTQQAQVKRATPADLHRFNTAVVLRYIWDHDGVSKAQIATATGLSFRAVKTIADDLLGVDLIQGNGLAPSQGGRPSMILRIRDSARYILAVDLARQHTRLALVTIRASIVPLQKEKAASLGLSVDETGVVQLKTPRSQESEPATETNNLRWLGDVIVRTLKAYGMSADRLLGVGIGAPGPGPLDGELQEPTNFRGWHHLQLRSMVYERVDAAVSVEVENDADAAALGWHFLCLKQEPYFIYLVADDGVGAGVIFANMLLRGPRGRVGEVGHWIVDVTDDAKLCGCGSRGCLETIATVQATVARWLRKAGRAEIAAVDEQDIAEFQTTGAEALVSAAMVGEPDACAAIYHTAHALGAGAVALCRAYDPSSIVVSSELLTAGAGELLLSPIRDAIAQTLRGSVEVRADILGENGKQTRLLGAACLVLDNLFGNSDPHSTGLLERLLGHATID